MLSLIVGGDVAERVRAAIIEGDTAYCELLLALHDLPSVREACDMARAELRRRATDPPGAA